MIHAAQRRLLELGVAVGVEDVLAVLVVISRVALDHHGAGAVCLKCTADLYRAMSLFRQGRSAEAGDAFAAAEAKMRPYPTDEQNPVADGPDQNDLIVWLAYREVKALLAETAKASK